MLSGVLMLAVLGVGFAAFSILFVSDRVDTVVRACRAFTQVGLSLVLVALTDAVPVSWSDVILIPALSASLTVVMYAAYPPVAVSTGEARRRGQ